MYLKLGSLTPTTSILKVLFLQPAGIVKVLKGKSVCGWLGMSPLFEATSSGDGTGDGKDGIRTEEALVRAVPSQVGSLVFHLILVEIKYCIVEVPVLVGYMYSAQSKLQFW